MKEDDSDQSWRQEIPREFYDVQKGTSKQKPKFKATTVLFVPNSNRGVLIKRLQQLEPMLSRLSGYTSTLVESAGTPLSRLFTLDLSDGRCHRTDCQVCSGFAGRGSSICKQKSVVYVSN